jgi:hypothetical protein
MKFTPFMGHEQQPEFTAECQQQAQLLRNTPGEKETLIWLESVAVEITDSK